MKDHGLRILRGWIGALICTCLAAASHTAVDGVMPPLAVIGLLLCISAVICTALASGKTSLMRTGLAVLLSQGAYHGAFGLFGHQHQGAAGLILESGAHAGHGLELGIGPTVAAATAAESPAGWLMTVAHVAAAIVTITAMRRGEIAARTFAQAISLYVPRLILFVRGLQATRGIQPLLGVAYRVLVLRDVLRPALHRRGPPRGPAFAHP
ncbi:hypothetical protein [Arthrobacter sp. UCD-GKA]|uniref:hypothetical protein n=1 Tax=Arthrobacter sp. UCD-GKA TaxID=1913576 RepID=UPI001113C713|nr:hypothetical protein [Arthrobacter sp. UCD-GKA]